MFLGIPAFHVADEAAGKSDRPVIVAIPPAIRAEQPLPFRRLVKPVGIVDGVAGFMAEIHHDLVRVFQIIHVFFQPGELAVSQIKRNANDRLS